MNGQATEDNTNPHSGGQTRIPALQPVIARIQEAIDGETDAWKHGNLSALLDSLCQADASGDVDARDKEGWTALMWAARYGQRHAVDVLLQLGADVNARNPDGNTPLTWAVGLEQEESDAHIAIMKRLIETGAHVDSAADDGNTPLMEAAATGHAAAVQLLLDEGANVNAVDGKGFSAFFFAEDAETMRILLANAPKGDEAIVRFLMSEQMVFPDKKRGPVTNLVHGFLGKKVKPTPILNISRKDDHLREIREFLTEMKSEIFSFLDVATQEKVDAVNIYRDRTMELLKESINSIESRLKRDSELLLALHNLLEDPLYYRKVKKRIELGAELFILQCCQTCCHERVNWLSYMADELEAAAQASGNTIQI